MACKEGQFDVVEVMVNDPFESFRINLNAQHVNGMTPYICTVIRYSRVPSKEEAEAEAFFFYFPT